AGEVDDDLLVVDVDGRRVGQRQVLGGPALGEQPEREVEQRGPARGPREPQRVLLGGRVTVGTTPAGQGQGQAGEHHTAAERELPQVDLVLRSVLDGAFDGRGTDGTLRTGRALRTGRSRRTRGGPGTRTEHAGHAG